MFITPIAGISVSSCYATNLKNTENIDKRSNFSAKNCVKPNLSNIQAYHTNIIFKGALVKPGLFKELAVNELHPDWQKLIARETDLYNKPDAIRSIFKRDYDRIMRSGAYTRTAGKTQIFSPADSDMTCSRNLHVNQVASIAEDISEYLGLNTKLTRAIAIGHDIGHAPFGHAGERILTGIMEKNEIKPKYWQEGFYHEKNSMRFADDIETLTDPHGFEKNLDLTYAVRDGITSHCGEVDENGLKPRTEFVDLRSIQKNNRPQPLTWEGCVVKLSDKISYLGTDLEDAIQRKILKPEKLNELKQTIKEATGEDIEEINNTNLINRFLTDLLENSNPQDGLRFSDKTFKLMTAIKKFTFENVCIPNDKIKGETQKRVLNSIFDDLNTFYDGKNTLTKLDDAKKQQKTVIPIFKDWLIKYSNIAPEKRAERKFANKIIYNMENQNDYKLAIIEFMSSMTDRFAFKIYKEIKS